MKISRVILLVVITFVSGLVLFGCENNVQDPNEIKLVGEWEKYKLSLLEIELNWDESYFIHDSKKIDIPSEWKVLGITQKKSDYNDFDKHDLVFQYKKRKKLYFGGHSTYDIEFSDIDHEKPNEEKNVYFNINILKLDIESKVLIQDEHLNDYYFKYDFNDDYNNFCYFKMAKNDILQLKLGSFNEIRLTLDVLNHYDGTKSFKLKNEDGITSVGYYKNVGIYFNPDLVFEGE